MARRAGRVRRMLMATGGVALLLYLGLAAFAWFCSDRLLFHPKPARYTDGPEILKIPAADGGRLSARYLYNPEAEFTILCSHGTSNDLGSDATALAELREHGYSAFEYDYRCYGTSSPTRAGRPSESSACQDAEAAYGYLVGTLHVPADRIIALGQSLGGGPATYLASRHPIGGLILESTFTSVFRLAVRVPLLPFDKFTNAARLAQVHCPVLVVHGTDDETIPFRHGQQLFRAAGQPKLCLWVEGAGHDDLKDVAGESYWESVCNLVELARNSRKEGHLQTDEAGDHGQAQQSGGTG
jgi:fermentation-respiration switch protein FrsA (DUF1100 family)